MSRFFSQAPWFESEINERRITIMLEQTASHRLKAEDSCLIIDDTLCEHVGSLFEYVARHYDHCENRYPIAHNLVTSHYISRAVRFPIDARIYRRYEEKTCWEAFVKKHFPDREIPTKKKERQLLHKEVDGVVLKDREFALLAQEFQTKITIAIQLIEESIKRRLPFQTVLIDSWYLSQDLVASLKAKQKDWVSLLKKNRKLETASFTLRDEQGKKVSLEGAHIKVEQLAEMIPSKAYKKATVKGKDYWYFALNVRVPDLGKVRIVISYDNEELSGTYAVLITNRRDWSAKKIIETYLQRWPIETFYQDSKRHLGFDEYRMRKAEAIKKHWCLVFVAYSLLHLDCLEASPMKRKKESQPIKTIGEACRQQGQALIERLIMISHELMQQGESAAEVFCKLFAKQQPVAAM